MWRLNFKNTRIRVLSRLNRRGQLVKLLVVRLPAAVQHSDAACYDNSESKDTKSELHINYFLVFLEFFSFV